MLLSPAGGTTIASEHDRADQQKAIDNHDQVDDANGNHLTHGSYLFAGD